VSRRAGDAAYTWPSAGAGNTIAVKSGAYSPRVVEPLAVAIFGELVEARPDLAGYPGDLAALARLEARAALLDRDLADRGLSDKRGKLRESALREWRACERQAAELRRELGLSPRSEAALRRDQVATMATAVDLDAVREAGRRTAARRSPPPAHDAGALPAGAVDTDDDRGGST